jgi:hypothetical protein
VADHLHDARNLICSHKAPALALNRDLIWHLVLFGLEDRSLMETNSRSMDAHVGKDNVYI